LDCRGNYEITDISFLYYLPIIERVNFKGMFLTKIPMPLTKCVVSTLKLLNLSDNRLTSLPQNFFQTFPNIQELYLYNNELSNIEGAGWELLRYLKILDLSRNRIVDVPNEFCELESLEQVRCFFRLFFVVSFFSSFC